jgi:hypothetical protein
MYLLEKFFLVLLSMKTVIVGFRGTGMRTASGIRNADELAGIAMMPSFASISFIRLLGVARRNLQHVSVLSCVTR